jgi:DNA polymerase III alpha subunit
LGLLSWEDTSTLRKAMSKSFGVEYFDKYWQRFKEGATSQGIKEEHALQMWNSASTKWEVGHSINLTLLPMG